MKPPAIEIIDVNKRFADVSALRSINLVINEGEFFSLLGPSGCGKTTLLRIIAGLDDPSSGKLLIGGKDMSDVPPHKRPTNMVFQSYALFPHLNVFDNVSFGLKIAGKCDRKEIEQKVAQALDLVRLPQMAARFPRELSGGQQQRVAFARAIVNQPFVLLLDEPLSALDPRVREEMKTELARFKRELGITFVMVTHDQSEAFALSDRIAVFNQGALEQVGSPQEIYERPRSAFVADFIGQTNVMDGTVSVCGEGAVTVRINQGMVLKGVTEGTLNLSEGDRVSVWIRTHSISVSADLNGGDGSHNRIPGKIIHRSYQGSRSDLVVDALGQRLLLSMDHENAEPPRIGQEVVLQIPPQATHVLK